ncbi:MAG: ABC transporter ATP-binding protein [Steroidobacteraceae bacterium]
MQNGASLIRLEGIRRIYLTDTLQTHALVDVNLEVRAGEYVSIEGPSGSGKSTLLAILGLMDEPSAGEYRLAGVPTAQIDAEERARLRNREIGFVFQSFNLIPEMTVAENVALPLTYRRGVKRAQRHAAAAEALARIGMSARARHFPAQLSGGQQQRAAIARALIGNPSLILADEPTGNLDQENGEQLMDLFDELNRDGATLVMVTHNPRYAVRAAHRLSMLDGQLLERA